MPRCKRTSIITFSETNWLSGICHLVAAVFALVSLASNHWIVISSDIMNSTLSPDAAKDMVLELQTTAQKCTSLSCLDFWRPVHFGGILDRNGNTHITFHSPNKVLLDCATPVIANVFYVIIAQCFVITITSVVSCIMSFFPPPLEFMHWIKRNTLLEMFNMLLALICCILAIVVQWQLSDLRPEDDISLGIGVFMISFSGFLSFLAAVATIRHTTKLNRMRRMDNQRIICARSLRSWRDGARRADDTIPIVDFERYLDSSSTS